MKNKQLVIETTKGSIWDLQGYQNHKKAWLEGAGEFIWSKLQHHIATFTKQSQSFFRISKNASFQEGTDKTPLKFSKLLMNLKTHTHITDLPQRNQFLSLKFQEVNFSSGAPEAECTQSPFSPGPRASVIHSHLPHSCLFLCLLRDWENENGVG